MTYGSDSTSGTIRITTPTPTLSPSGSASVIRVPIGSSAASRGAAGADSAVVDAASDLEAWAATPTRRVSIPRAYSPSSSSSAPDLRSNAFRPAAERYRDVMRSNSGPGAARTGSSSSRRSLDALIDRYSHRGRALGESGLSSTDRSRVAPESSRPSSRRSFYGAGPLDRLNGPSPGTRGGDSNRLKDTGDGDRENSSSRTLGPSSRSSLTANRRGSSSNSAATSRSLLGERSAEPNRSRSSREASLRAADGLRRLIESDRSAADRLIAGGRAAARANSLAASAAISSIHGEATGRLVREAFDPSLPGLQANPDAGIGGGNPSSGYPGTGYPGSGVGSSAGSFGFGFGWSSNYGFGLGFGPYGYGFGNCFYWGLNSSLWGCWPYYNSFCDPYWGGWGWNNCWYSPWSFGWGGLGYGYNWCPPLFYSTVMYSDQYQEDEPAVVVVESEPQVIVIEQSAPAVGVNAAQPSGNAPANLDGGIGAVLGNTAVLPALPAQELDPLEISVAADRYLTLGDRAFRDERFADAVYYYTRATELEPGTGVLYLVLSDALFATGDFAYAAYAVRRAIDLDPMLVSGGVDKRSFYADAQAFDRQLAVLELYLKEHPADGDARLVLAVNQLFGGAPAAAVDTLEDPLAGDVLTDPGVRRVLEVARELQFGEPAK